MKRKLISLALSAFLVVGGVALAAPAAHADQGTLPSGCSLAASAPTVSATKIKYSGSGYCDPSSNGITKLHVEVWHWWSWLPAVAVHSSADWYGPDFAAGYSICDNGGTADYFTKAAYWRNSGGDIIRESGVRSLTHC